MQSAQQYLEYRSNSISSNWHNCFISVIMSDSTDAKKNPTQYALQETNTKTGKSLCHTVGERWRSEPSDGRAQGKGPLTRLGSIREGFLEEGKAELSPGTEVKLVWQTRCECHIQRPQGCKYLTGTRFMDSVQTLSKVTLIGKKTSRSEPKEVDKYWGWC